MISIRVYILCAVTILLSQLSCSVQKGKNYLPLKVGSQWEYSVEMITQDDGKRTKGKMVTRVDGKKEINNKQYFEVVFVLSGFPGEEPKIRYLRKASEGIYVVRKEQMNEPEQLELPASPEVGQTWMARNMEFSFVGYEDVVLLHHTYKECMKITNTVKEAVGNSDTLCITGVLIYAPDIGLYSSTYTMNHSIGVSVQATMQLEKYTK